MATGDIWRLAYEGTLFGSQYVNTFHVRFKSEAADIGEAIGGFNVNFFQLIKNQSLVNDWSITICRARKLTVPALLYESAISCVGAEGAGEGLPPQSAMVVTLRTGIAGRSRRGRLYISGFTEASQADGTWSGALVTNYQNIVDDLVALYGSGGTSPDYEWGVWSRTLGGEDPGPYNLVNGWRAITAGVVRTVVHTQRRRVAGVGR